MSYQEFTIKQNDKKPALVATLKDEDGNVVDLSHVVAIDFKMRLRGASENKVDSHEFTYARIQGDPKDGKIQYLWQDGDTDTPGMYEAEFELIYRNDEGIQHVPTDEPFIVHVVRDRIA